MKDEDKALSQHFERVINNLNEHWGAINDLLNWISQPVRLDDRNLRSVCNDLRSVCNDLSDKIDTCDISQALEEIKFIGKRLNAIEKDISKIKNEGLRKKINLEFRCDGYELVKKQINYDPTEPIEDPDLSVKELLQTITERERNILVSRFGLFGSEERTLESIGIKIHLSAGRVRMILDKTLRKLRHKSRAQLVSKLPVGNLKKEILGDLSQ
jgi:DNA-directed RNA polymerase sigma subunit (sigma70/sigma32)